MSTLTETHELFGKQVLMDPTFSIKLCILQNVDSEQNFNAEKCFDLFCMGYQLRLQCQVEFKDKIQIIFERSKKSLKKGSLKDNGTGQQYVRELLSD